MPRPHLILTVSPDRRLVDPTKRSNWKVHNFIPGHADFTDPAAMGIDMVGRGGMPLVRTRALQHKFDKGLAFWLSYTSTDTREHFWTLLKVGSRDADVYFWNGQRLAGALVWQSAGSFGGKTYETRRAFAITFIANYTSWCNRARVSYSLVGHDGYRYGSHRGFYSIREALTAIEADMPLGHGELPIIVKGKLAHSLRYDFRVSSICGHPIIDEDDLPPARVRLI